MSDYCSEHEDVGLNEIDPKRLLCPDCEHVRLSDRIAELEQEVKQCPDCGAVMGAFKGSEAP
jgi:hypothetical protein